MEDPSDELAPWGRFVAVRRLGEGGMGVVYEAVDASGRRVAVKILRELRGDAIYRFKAEFRSLQDLHHPNLVKLGELIERDSRYCFTMELLDGVDFREYVGAEAQSAPTLKRADFPTHVGGGASAAPRYDELRLRSALAQLARGLCALHAAGKVHRDVKPSNIVITHGGRLVLLDLGLVREVEWRQSTDEGHEVVGTAAYMAPEQVTSGDVGPAADWYAVGVMLYSVLAGRLPFEGALLEVLMRKRTDTPTPLRELNAHVPADLERLTTALLSVDPAARPDGADILRLVGERLGDARPRAAGARVPFVGRAAEVSALVDAFRAAVAGSPQVVFVQGPSGIGKTALMRTFLDQAAAAEPSCVFLEGRCYEREAVPFKAVDAIIDALSRYLSRLPPDEVAALLPPHAEMLGHVFPVLGRVQAIASAPRLPDLAASPEERRALLFRTLRELVQRILARHPVVISIDDLQNSDADSLSLLIHLLRPPNAPPLLFVATTRVDVALAEIPVRTLRLEPLQESEANELARCLLDAESGSNAARLAEEARGHPLFIAELVRYSRQQNSDDVGRPATLEQVLARRFEQLPPVARRVLELIAVAARPIEQALALEAAGESSAGLELIEDLRRDNLVRTRGPRATDVVEAYHDRIKETVVGQLSQAALAAHHGRLAALFESRGADPETLATHFEQAGDTDKARTYTLLAAKRAAEALAFDAAGRLFRAGLRLARQASGQVPPTMYQEVGDACLQAGIYDVAAECFGERLKSGGTSLERSELLRKAAEVEVRRGDTIGGARLLERVLETLGWPLAKSRAGLFARLLVSVTRFAARVVVRLPRRKLSTAGARSTVEVIERTCSRLAEAFYFSDFYKTLYYLLQSVDAAERLGPGRELTVAWAQTGYVLCTIGMYRLGFRYLDRARAVGETAASPVELAWEATMRAFAHGCRGEPDAHEREATRAEMLLRQVVEPLRLRQAWVVHAEALLMQGRLGEAHEIGTRLRAITEELGDERGRGWALYVLGLVALRRGRRAQAIELLRDASAASQAGGDLVYQLTASARLVYALAVEGQAALAVEIGARSAREFEERRLRHLTTVIDGAFLFAAAAARRAGNDDRALDAQVAHVRRSRRGYARCMQYTTPLFAAGEAAWAFAAKPGDAPSLLAGAIAAAERRALIGELHDVHVLACTLFADGSPERALHEQRVAELRAKMA